MSFFHKKLLIIHPFSLIYLRKYQTFRRKKKSPVTKSLQKVFQTCKNDVLYLLIFKKLQKTFQFFLTRCENCLFFFLQMRKVFHFFRKNAKNVIHFLIKCETCFNNFDKMRKMFHIFNKMREVFHFFSIKCENCFNFFYKVLKPLGTFLLVYSFSIVFPNMYAKIIRVFNICASLER